ncbi:hypothetical protein QQ054_32000 [Oscillatoria amoena NRMC-F 0135]|nr:hypothetical protein [Oscillatoria amoena NRMC-F 0135]
MKNFKNIVMTMVGHAYDYAPKGESVLIRDWKFENDTLFIVTDKGTFTAEFTDVDAFLKKFTPADTSKLSLQVVRPQLETQVFSDGLLSGLRDTVLGNIERLKKEKDFLPQATEINNQVKTLIDLAKTELDFIKTAHVIGNK